MLSAKTAGLKPIKLTAAQERVLAVIRREVSATTILYKSEMAAADQLFELGLIARNTLHVEYVTLTVAGRKYIENRGG